MFSLLLCLLTVLAPLSLVMTIANMRGITADATMHPVVAESEGTMHVTVEGHHPSFGVEKEYLAQQKEIGAAYRDIMGRHWPVMAVIQVAGFIEDGAKLEIEATAIIPDDEGSDAAS